MTGPANRVEATPEALELVARLRDKHGPIAFFQSAGRCDGSAPICLTRGELLEGPNDLRVGRIGGAPFFVDAERYERWNRPRFVIDVSPGAPGGFSLEGQEDVHFVARSPRETVVR
jgi:uncharacterized protein (DUF779 family)